MSSINFNQSALVALDTLRTINSNLEMTQNVISTGKEISSAKDNSAVWAISKVMDSDVAGFEAIQDSLNLGSSTVAVARGASEQVTNLLTEMKELIISSQESNVDRTKIQADVDALREQIADIVDAAQFNGLNLLKGSTSVDVLSSLNRSGGTVTKDTISVARNDLTASVASTTTDIASGAGFVSANGGAQTIQSSGTASVAVTVDAGTLNVNERAVLDITVGGVTYQFEESASAGDTQADVLARLKTKFDAAAVKPAGVTITATTAGDDTVASVYTFTETADSSTSVELSFYQAGAATGGLAGIAAIDVTNTTDAATALTTIETLIQTSIDAAASFGSAENRIEIQNDFVQSLVDSLDAGISALTDANLEEASARLQSLQVQQQLNIQALTIANQSPQAILALFR